MSSSVSFCSGLSPSSESSSDESAMKVEAARVRCLAPLGRGVGGGEKWTKQALLDLELTAEKLLQPAQP